MSRLARWLHRVTARRPMREIQVTGAPYLNRYYLFSWGPLEVYLHQFLTGDGDEHLHDHPFRVISAILTGGYYEERGIESLTQDSADLYEHAAPSLRWIGMSTVHRVVSVLPNTWTLMMCWRVRLSWGFFRSHSLMGISYTGMKSAPGWWKAAKSREQREQEQRDLLRQQHNAEHDRKAAEYKAKARHGSRSLPDVDLATPMPPCKPARKEDNGVAQG